MKKIFLLAVAASAFLTSCTKDEEKNAGGIFKGPVAQVHHGKAWTWIETDNSGNPVRLAVTIEDAALNSVPTETHSGDGHHSHENSWNLQFHPKASVTPFTYLGMGWNPHGHEPEMFYGEPHFDFHFYMMPKAEIEAIPPYELDSVRFNNWPSAAYFPPMYINPGGGVPQMGAHWVDVTSGEFNGAGFTQTFIYGSFNGKVNFYEPMITLAFLKNAANSNFERNIPQPSKVQKTGYYPTKLKIKKHDGVTDVILDGFTYRVQS